MADTIRPGEIWRDTAGEPIHVHGGSILHDGGRYYWYGENKEKTDAQLDIWHWGIRCYVSDDLTNWEDLGLIVPPDEDDTASPLHPAQKMDRPHIVRHPTTGQYVCWIKVMGNAAQETSVLTSDALLGPWVIATTGLMPLGMSAGDFDLVVDPDTGAGHYYFERVHSDLIVADLTEDLTGVTGHYSSHFPHDAPPDVREAPSFFRRGDDLYLVTSGTSWYYPNQSQVAVARDHHGPWTVLEDPHPTDASRTSFRTQISSVFRHPEKQDLYIALGDRWLPDVSVEESHRAIDLFREGFAGDKAAMAEIDAMIADTSSVSDARHVWLPLRFEGRQPIIDWRDEWSPADFD